MAKKKSEDVKPMDAVGVAATIIESLNKNAKGTPAYQAGEHRKFTYGIPIPHLAFQWMIGGSNILPIQRIYSASGAPKSFKSTLMVEIGKWFVQANGIFFDIDNESKTSATMLEAMTWHCLDAAQQQRIIYQMTQSTEEWQNKVLGIMDYVRTLAMAEKGARIPVYIGVDSLTGSTSGDTQEEMAKEGEAKARGFPINAMLITNFLKSFNLSNSTASLGYVRHAKPSLDPAEHQKLKEAGGMEASFRSSISIMMKRIKGLAGASHPALPSSDISYEGAQIKMKSEMSCLGPDKRELMVNILWQYVDVETTETDEAGNPITEKSRRQLMLYDWAGALGEKLWAMKYEKDECPVSDKVRLISTLDFVAKGKLISCEELKLEEVSYTEFGKAIEASPTVRKKISNFLGITNYQSVQHADIFVTAEADK